MRCNSMPRSKYRDLLHIALILCLWVNPGFGSEISASGSRPSGCLTLYLQALDTKPRQTALKPRRLEKWLKAHKRSPELQDALRWLAKRIQIRSKQEVQDSVASSFRRFLEQNDNHPFVF